MVPAATHPPEIYSSECQAVSAAALSPDGFGVEGSTSPSAYRTHRNPQNRATLIADSIAPALEFGDYDRVDEVLALNVGDPALAWIAVTNLSGAITNTWLDPELNPAPAIQPNLGKQLLAGGVSRHQSRRKKNRTCHGSGQPIFSLFPDCHPARICARDRALLHQFSHPFGSQVPQSVGQTRRQPPRDHGAHSRWRPIKSGNSNG